MKRIAIFMSILLLICLLQGFPVHAQEQAAATLLLEARTENILAQENADAVLPVGSLAKLMTAYLAAQAMENGDFTKETVLTAGDAVTGTKGAVIWLEAGDTITVDELLMGLLAGNANDAASVLAVTISGSIPAFVGDMNAAAFDLGMRSTHFTTPQGYDDPMAYSTAKDMGTLACAVLKYEVLTPYLTTWRTFIRNETVEVVNENTLTRIMEDCRGLKAGHSDAAGHCLIAACERDGMICVAVVLGCEDKDDRFAIAKRLLNSGFQNYKITTPALSEEFLMPLKIKGGTESAVLLKLSSTPELSVPAGADDPETVLVLPNYVQAPLSAGQQVGMVYFYHGDTLLCGTALLAEQDVPEISFSYALKKVLRFLFT
ncbi:MAG: D-alanyl-D-alanine carboxypeptidase [Ruminococcus sp.]|nr:D-alanyl-D-alanine carboxypeptidase [Ruminococcus sp.]